DRGPVSPCRKPRRGGLASGTQVRVYRRTMTTMKIGNVAVTVPPACTLPTPEQPLRLAEFATLFAAALHHADRAGPARLGLTLAATDAREAATRDLAARERQCCTFFAFTVTRAGDLLHLDVGVPAAQVAVLNAIEALARDALAARPAGGPSGAGDA